MSGGVLGRLRRRFTAPLGHPDGRVPGPRATADRLWPSSDDGITVSYAPDRDGDADPGEVVWAWVPYEEDAAQGKDRPVLVIGYQNHLLVGLQLSSRSHRDRADAVEWIEIGRGAWDSKGRVSYVDASRLLRFIPSEIRREGAALHPDVFARVVSRVAALHGWEANAAPSRPSGSGEKG